MEARLGKLSAQLAALADQEAAPESVNKELPLLDNIWANHWTASGTLWTTVSIPI